MEDLDETVEYTLSPDAFDERGHLRATKPLELLARRNAELDRENDALRYENDHLRADLDIFVAGTPLYVENIRLKHEVRKLTDEVALLRAQLANAGPGRKMSRILQY